MVSSQAYRRRIRCTRASPSLPPGVSPTQWTGRLAQRTAGQDGGPVLIENETRLITQNVDGLHEAAGSPAVEALHGRLSEVVCLSCGVVSARSDLQARLAARKNQQYKRPGAPQSRTELRPPGMSPEGIDWSLLSYVDLA